MTQSPVTTDALELASDEQLTIWAEKFTGYRKPPTREALLEWLSRFEPAHLPIAHKVLDAVLIVSETEIQHGYKDGLNGLPGWSRSAAQREGRWFFVGAGSAGESGLAMLRLFREANGLQHPAWQPFFVTVRELPDLQLSALDSVVFVDDFAGTGTQMADYWRDFLQELVASEARCYLLLTAITTEAESKIENETELRLRSRIILQAKDNLFSEESEVFDQDEREILDNYGRIASKASPRGFGDCGLTIVLSHKTPNNTLPILHANHRKWTSPFPRNLIQAA